MILVGHTKQQCNKIVEYVGADQDRFDELVKYFYDEEYRIVQRAAWPLGYCVIKHPALIKKHLNKMVKNLKNPHLSIAIKRNTVRFLQHITLPKSLHGDLMESCFKFLIDPKETIAVRVFSMSVLANLAKEYPEIKSELRSILDDVRENKTPAFRSRSRKVMKELERN